jgi:hypothetical protein
VTLLSSSVFEEKNTRRRIAKQRNRLAFREGRRNRAEWAWQGAFGVEIGRIYNDCVRGTSAPPRHQKHDEEDEPRVAVVE